jgi:hypothetical protein
MLFAIIQGQPDSLLDHRLQTIHGRVHQTRLARYFGQLWLRIAQDVVLGWLPRIANGPFQSGGTPGLHPGAFSAVPAGLGRFWNLYPGLRPGLLSAVPTGLDLERAVSRSL